MINFNLAICYPYFVEYIDENGIHSSESMNEKTLLQEINRKEITILHITKREEGV